MGLNDSPQETLLVERVRRMTEVNPTPTVSIVGRVSSDRMNLIEKLVPRFKALGYRIAVVKHDVHGFEMDREGKTTWRYSNAGSDVVIISSSTKMALIRQTGKELSLAEIEEYVRGSVDLLITDGYLSGDKPKIEVSREPESKDILCSLPELIAVVSEGHYNLNIPQFAMDDINSLAEFIIDRFLVKK